MRISEWVILQGRRTSHRYISKGFSEGAIKWVYQGSSKRFESGILMVYFAFLEKSHKIYLIIKSNKQQAEIVKVSNVFLKDNESNE